MTLAGSAWLRVDDGRNVLRPLLQRLALLVLVLMDVIGADDAGWPVCKHGFRDVVRDAELRQTGADDAAQVVVGPSRQRDGVMIFAATAGQRLAASGACAGRGRA